MQNRGQVSRLLSASVAVLLMLAYTAFVGCGDRPGPGDNSSDNGSNTPNGNGDDGNNDDGDGNGTNGGDDTPPITVELQRLQGVVLDAVTDAPIAGVVVTIADTAAAEGRQEEPVLTDTSDVNGIFELSPDGSGAYELTATPADEAYQAAIVPLSIIGAVPIAVRLLPAGLEVASLAVSPDEADVPVDLTEAFSATVALTSEGSARPTWSVVGGVGYATGSGTFRATAGGSGQVVATLGGREARASVVVLPCDLNVRNELDVTPPGATGCSTRSLLREMTGVQPVIVGYRDAEACRAAIEGAGGTVTGRLELISALAGELPAEAADRVESSPAVRYVSWNAPVSLRAQTLPWGIDIINAERVWGLMEDATALAGTPLATGRGVRVGVVDTGIDAEHPDLVVAGGWNIIRNDSTWDDDQGHGTFAAGIIGARDNGDGIVGVAPECELYAVKVLDSRGSGDIDDVIAGIEWCVTNGMQVINLSIGVTFCDQPLKEACDAAYDNGRGAVLVGASGNVGQDRWTAWPANFASVIAVGATRESGSIASFSVTGVAVELAAPGQDVMSTDLGGTYATESGTSFSAPHVAGVAALVWSTGRYSTAERVRQHLRDTAIELGDAGRDTTYGFGLVDAFSSVMDRSCTDR